MVSKSGPELNIALVGAGFGGLAAAIGFKTKWGLNNFVIYERGADIGGTWRDNTYPGCASDVPIHFYHLSTDPKPDWGSSHGTQPEILEYMHGVVDKYDLRPHCRFHTSVDNAEWDANANMWCIETRDVRTGEKQLSYATALVSAIGVLVVPRFPEIQGIESFKGEMFHSARWRHDVDLRGKRVGVLGSGCSATQFIPRISKDPTVTVVNFVRTPMWYIPGPILPYSRFAKWAFSNIPFVQLIYRFIIAATYESAFMLFKTKGNNYLGRTWRKTSEDYIKSTAPAKYHHLIIPNYPIGCRRLVRDQGYLESLHRPNVRLTVDHITRIEPDGVVMETGERIPLDVLICGTGFVTDDYPLNVRGTRETLKEYNDAHGGPTAYLGSTVPGFPNFFMMQGPNTTTGHTSVLYSEESQVTYLLQLLDPVRVGVLNSVAPTDAATDRYNDMLQKRLEDSVWTQCASWYRTGSRGRVFSTFPGPLLELWWWLRTLRWEDHEVEGPGVEKWRRRRAQQSCMRLLAMVILAGALGTLAFAVLYKGVKWSEIVAQAENVVRNLWKSLVQRFRW